MAPATRGFVDLHCHYLPGIDDGVRTEDEGVELLRALAAVGFSHVVATPHIRPEMFDNDQAGIRSAYASMRARLDRETGLPETSLAAEHYFDDGVYARLLRGEGVPYGVGRAALVEFSVEHPTVQVGARFYDLRRKRLRPVVAHPERYLAFWSKPLEQAEKLRRAGGVLLLDVCALDGKYGAKAQRTAEALVDDDAYYAACSDAHRPADAEAVARAIRKLDERVGPDEVTRLLSEGPRSVLAGNILDEYD